MASTLFRGEVLRRQGDAALGEPVQIVPLPQVAFTAFLAAILLVAIVYAALAGYSQLGRRRQYRISANRASSRIAIILRRKMKTKVSTIETRFE